jgi:hypothetical protein
MHQLQVSLLFFLLFLQYLVSVSFFSNLFYQNKILVINRYLLNVKHSPLVISAIICSFAGVLLSIIPKQWFQPGEAAKMKQALGLGNKDSNLGAGAALLNSGGTTTGTSSAFEEIRAQRRIRNALLYNEIKT